MSKNTIVSVCFLFCIFLLVACGNEKSEPQDLFGQNKENTEQYNPILNNQEEPPSLLNSLKHSKSNIKPGGLYDFTFSPDGSLILVSSCRGFGLYLSSDLSQVWFLPHESSFTPRFSEDGTKIIANETILNGEGIQKSLCFHNTTDGELIRTIPVDFHIYSLEPFPDDKFVFMAVNDRAISIVNVDDEAFYTSTVESNCMAQRIDVNKGNRVITAACNQIDIWNTKAEKICSLNIDELIQQELGTDISAISLLDDGQTAVILRNYYGSTLPSGLIQGGNIIEIVDVCQKKIIKSSPISSSTVLAMDVSKQGEKSFIAFVVGNKLKFMRLDDFSNIYNEVNLPYEHFDLLKISPRYDRILLLNRDAHNNGSLVLVDNEGNVINIIDGFSDE